MGTIDERIVKLSFDNKGFESGIQKTLSSLEALNKALEKTDNRQAAKELSKSMNDINNKIGKQAYTEEMIKAWIREYEDKNNSREDDDLEKEN